MPYFIFSDGRMRQLANLGNTGEAIDISRMTKFIYGRGIRKQAMAGHHFFSISHWNAKALQLEHDVKPSQITIIPPMVDSTYWQPRSAVRDAGQLRVVFIVAGFDTKVVIGKIRKPMERVD